MVEIRPEFKAALQKSELMDTVSAIYNANILRVLVEAPISCASAAKRDALRKRSRLISRRRRWRRRVRQNSRP